MMFSELRARHAVEKAAAARARHRRRRLPDRTLELSAAYAELLAAMVALRPAIYHAARHGNGVPADLREVSAALQRERRKLWKMLR